MAKINTGEVSIAEQLDASGLKCPEPVMLLHNTLAELAPGKVVLMKATDPTTVRDVNKFCKYLGHELLAAEEKAGLFSYTIRKKGTRTELPAKLKAELHLDELEGRNGRNGLEERGQE